jgi:hypothetical protein
MGKIRPNPRQERILEYLTPDANTKLRDLTTYLGVSYNEKNLDSIRDDLRPLIQTGYVESEVLPGTPKEVAYRLTRFVGKGLKKKVLGVGIKHQVKSTWDRWFGSILVIFSLAFLAYQDFSSTGNIIANQSFITSEFGFIIALGVLVFGEILFMKSFKQNHS